MIGASAATAALIGAWSIPVLTALFGAAGASLGSYNAAVLTAEISEFMFVPVRLPSSLEQDVEDSSHSDDGVLQLRASGRLMLNRNVMDNTLDMSASSAWTPIEPSFAPDNSTFDSVSVIPPVPGDTDTDTDNDNHDNRDPGVNDVGRATQSFDSMSVENMMASSFMLDRVIAESLLNASLPPPPPLDESATGASNVPEFIAPLAAVAASNGSEDTGGAPAHLVNVEPIPIKLADLGGVSVGLREAKPPPDGGLSVPGAQQGPEPVLPGLRVTICVNGWLWEEDEYQTLWQSVREHDPTAECYTIRWQTQDLTRLGRALVGMLTNVVAGKVVDIGITRLCSAAVASVYGSLMLPVTAASITNVMTNPWTVVSTQARRCGKLLAAALLSRAHGNRPVTLIGFAHASALIFRCLEELAAAPNGEGIVENVFLIGSAVPGNPERWAPVRRVVAGRLVNAYCTSDWVLAVLCRTANVMGQVAGIAPVACDGVENIDITHLSSGHLMLKQRMHVILQYLHIASSVPVDSPDL